MYGFLALPEGRFSLFEDCEVEKRYSDVGRVSSWGGNRKTVTVRQNAITKGIPRVWLGMIGSVC